MSLDYLNSVVRYEPDTGVFYSRITGEQRYLEPTKHGPRISIGGKNYVARHLAYWLQTGVEPAPRTVRCVNGDRYDLRFSNLTTEPPATLLCKTCNTERPIGDFKLRADRNNQRYTKCITCVRERAKGYALHHKYRMDEPSYTRLLAAQNNACAICKHPPGKKRLAVDHCHTNNLVRGLLCSKCNAAIGLLKDSPELLQSAIDYLKKSVPNF